MRQDCRSSRKCPLQRILKVQQAEVILAPLADDDPTGALLRYGKKGRWLTNVNEVAADVFIKTADDNLYKAKRSGRNRVVG